MSCLCARTVPVVLVCLGPHRTLAQAGHATHLAAARLAQLLGMPKPVQAHFFHGLSMPAGRQSPIQTIPNYLPITYFP